METRTLFQAAVQKLTYTSLYKTLLGKFFSFKFKFNFF
jgi:hypothetical protein